MLTYSDENKLGSQHATQAIEDCRATGDLPRLVREIREMVAADDGVSIGFMYALAERVAAGRV